MKPTVVLVLVQSLFVITSAQPIPDTLWTRTYGTSDQEYAFSVQQTVDDGYIVAGETYSTGTGNSAIYLVKTTAQGDTLWTRVYGGSFTDEARCVQQTSDGGYVVAGATASSDTGVPVFYLMKTNDQGDTLWTRTYESGLGMVSLARSVLQTNDGGYIVAGYAFLSDVISYLFYLVRTNSQGDTLWTHTYGESSYNDGLSIQPTADGGYIVAGETSLGVLGNRDFYVVKVDEYGDSLWTRHYGGSDADVAYSVQQTTDGGYIVGGWTRSFGAGEEDFYLVRIDSNGDTLWTRTYGGDGHDVAFSVLQAVDGGYLMTGYTDSFDVGYGDFYLVKINSQGEIQWTRTYGGELHEEAWGLQQTNDGGYIIAGWTQSSGAGDYDFYLVKTGPELDTTEPLAPYPSSFAFTACPNPFNAVTRVEFALPKSARVMIRAYDVLGRDVGTIADDVFAAGQHSVSWQCAECASGVYFITMSGEGFHLVQKAILLR